MEFGTPNREPASFTRATAPGQLNDTVDTVKFSNVFETLENQVSYNRELVERLGKVCTSFKHVTPLPQPAPEVRESGELLIVTGLLDKAYRLRKNNEMLSIMVNHLENLL